MLKEEKVIISLPKEIEENSEASRYLAIRVGNKIYINFRRYLDEILENPVNVSDSESLIDEALRVYRSICRDLEKLEPKRHRHTKKVVYDVLLDRRFGKRRTIL